MNNTTMILLIAAAAAFFYFSQKEEIPVPVLLPAGAIPPGTDTKAAKWQLAFSIFNSLIASGMSVYTAWNQANQNSTAYQNYVAAQQAEGKTPLSYSAWLSAGIGGCLNNRNDFYAI